MKASLFQTAVQRGQALVESILFLPILILAVLVIVQLAIVMDRQQKTRMVTWYALRSQSYDSSHRKVSADDVERTLKEKIFPEGDEIEVNYRSVASIIDLTALLDPVMLPEERQVTIVCKTPYLFKGVKYEWPGLNEVFENVVDEDDGRIHVQAQNQMVRNRWGL